VDLVHEEAHPVGPNPRQAALVCIQVRCINCLLIQLVLSVDHLVRKNAMVISLVHQVFLSFKQLPPSTTRTQNVTEMQHCAISYHYHTLLTQIRLQPLSCRQADSVSGRQTHRQATCVDDLLRFLFNICHRWRQADNASHGRNVLPHKTASSPLVKTSRLAGQRPDLVSLTTCQPSTQTSLTH